MPLAPHRAHRARGCSWESSISVKLPPLGNRPRGSRVWQGVTPCTPYRATGRGAARTTCGSGFYRRGTTGATARRFGRLPCRLASSYRHSATGLMARYKGQRGFEIPLAFCAAKIPKSQENIPTCKGCVCPTPTADRRKRPFIIAANSSSYIGVSQPARGKHAHRRLRGSRAAIGSGGKKARPF